MMIKLFLAFVFSFGALAQTEFDVTFPPTPTGAKPIYFCNAETNGNTCNVIPASATSIQVRMGDIVSTLLNILGGLVGADSVFTISCEYTEGL